jgi:hypothetical protein
MILWSVVLRVLGLGVWGLGRRWDIESVRDSWAERGGYS